MKKTFTTLLLFLACIANAQTNYKVGTAQEDKKVMLEEFTAIHCMYCAVGHQIADRLQMDNKDRVYLVNVHCGSLAKPGKNEIDLRSEASEKLSDDFKSQSFGQPSGLINRHKYGKYIFTSYGSWKDFVGEELKEKAPLNLYSESVYDGKAGEIRVHVEGYAFDDLSDKDLRLNVILTQDYILGTQTGALNSSEYMHMDVFRDFVIDSNGDSIGALEKGKYFVRDYVYKVPEKTGTLDFKIQDMKVIAFVTSDGLRETLNSNMSKPQITNYVKEAAGEIYKPDLRIVAKYGYKYFEAFVKNVTAEQVKKATFDITINGKVSTCVAECDIAPFGNQTVKIPCDYEFDEKGIVKYEMVLKGLNDNSVTSQTIKGQFARPKYSDGNITVEIKTDMCASQNKICLKDEDGKVIKEFGPYENGVVKTYEEKIELEEGKSYCVELTDSYKDGMEEGGKGYLIVKNGNGKTIDQFYSIKGSGVRSFFTVNKELAIENVSADNVTDNKTYTLNGVMVNKGYKGIIINNGKKFLTK